MVNHLVASEHFTETKDVSLSTTGIYILKPDGIKNTVLLEHPSKQPRRNVGGE